MNRKRCNSRTGKGHSSASELTKAFMHSHSTRHALRALRGVLMSERGTPKHENQELTHSYSPPFALPLDLQKTL